MNVTKLDLSKNISRELDLSLEDSKKFINDFFKLKKILLKKKNLKISKFGTYKKRISPKRIGRNPKTLIEYTISQQSKISFKSSKKIKDIIN